MPRTKTDEELQQNAQRLYDECNEILEMIQEAIQGALQMGGCQEMTPIQIIGETFNSLLMLASMSQSDQARIKLIQEKVESGLMEEEQGMEAVQKIAKKVKSELVKTNSVDSTVDDLGKKRLLN